MVKYIQISIHYILSDKVQNVHKLWWLPQDYHLLLPFLWTWSCSIMSLRKSFGSLSCLGVDSKRSDHHFWFHVSQVDGGFEPWIHGFHTENNKRIVCCRPSRTNSPCLGFWSSDFFYLCWLFYVYAVFWTIKYKFSIVDLITVVSLIVDYFQAVDVSTRILW